MNIAIKSENMNTRQALAGKVSLIGSGIARALAAAGSEVVLNGFGKPEEVAAVQAKIASAAASITGVALLVDGGWTAH